MDLPAFAASLLPSAEQLLTEWFPAGQWAGQEFQIGNIRGEPGRSLSVNSLTGAWADFAEPDQRGLDLLSLYAAKHGLRQSEAAKQLGWSNGGGQAITAPVKRLQATPDEIPDDAPDLPGTVPQAIYRYGRTFLVARYEPGADGKAKDFKQWTWRGGKWSGKGYPAPRPLFGVELLVSGLHVSSRRVLLVEGEKACLAARELFGRAYSVLTWAGGAGAVGTVDWKPLYGLDVDIWPDADVPGNKAAAAIVERLLPHIGTAQLRVLDQEGQPDGWDIADAIADGWDLKRIAAHIKRDNGTHIKRFDGKALQVGRPHDGKAPIEGGEPLRSGFTWHQELALARNAGLAPYETEDNAVLILAGHPQFAGRFWLDEFANRLMYGDKPFDRIAAIAALIFIQQQLYMRKLPLQSLERAAQHVGFMNRRHPVREWLSGLKWDGVDRLNTLMADAFGTDQDDYHASVGRCWLVSMIARVMQPGCQADYMPVFEGKQGTFKSSAMRIIGGQWFVESHSDPIHDRKEFLQGLQGHWLIEIPEMHTIAGRGNGIEKIKGIITNRIDSYRVPYGVTVEPFPRQCIFAGTTNHDQWNPDSTGGRRFWPITCAGIELDYLSANRDQLFAEAVTVYERTHNWYDVPMEDAQREQDARRESDVWEEYVLPYAERVGEVSVSECLMHCLEIPKGQAKQNDQNRIGRILRANGYLRVNANIGGRRQWIYRKSKALARSLGLPLDDEF